MMHRRGDVRGIATRLLLPVQKIQDIKHTMARATADGPCKIESRCEPRAGGGVVVSRTSLT